MTAVVSGDRPDAIDYGALGTPIHGPRALSGGWRRFWHLTFNIAVTNWKLRFFGSVLGYFWQLMRPLLLFLVLYVFFTKVSKVDDQHGAAYRYYGAQLLSSVVLFTFFSEATSSAVRCVVDNEALVRKIQFPRMVIPASTVLLSLFNLGLNLIVVTIFALIAGVRPMWTWFELPLIVLLLVVLCTGLAMLISALFVYFRDIQPIWEVVNQIVFYASPIIIPIMKVKETLVSWLFFLYMLNPLATVLQQFRHAYIDHGSPSVATLMGSSVDLVVPIGIACAIFVLGFYTFNRVAPKVAEDL